MPLLFGGHNLPPLVELDLLKCGDVELDLLKCGDVELDLLKCGDVELDLLKCGGTMAPPAPPGTTGLRGKPGSSIAI